MSNVKRVYVEKKPGFGVQAGSLKSEIKSYYNGRLDTISVVIMMLQDEEMFESMSDDLVKNADTIKKEIEKYAEK